MQHEPMRLMLPSISEQLARAVLYATERRDRELQYLDQLYHGKSDLSGYADAKSRIRHDWETEVLRLCKSALAAGDEMQKQLHDFLSEQSRLYPITLPRP